MSIFFAAIFLGFIYNAVPGPIFAESMKRGLTGGYSAALCVQLGSLSGDALWAILGLSGIGLLMSVDSLRIPLGIGGSCYLIYLAMDAWRHAKDQPISSNQSTHSSALLSGALLSLTSPHNIGYWIAIGSVLGSLGVQSPAWQDYSIFFIGFMVASVIWCFVCAGLIGLLAKQLNRIWTRLTYQIVAIVFLMLFVICQMCYGNGTLSTYLNLGDESLL